MKKIFLLLFTSLLLVSCGQIKPDYDFYADRENEEVLNKYEGDGNDFHLSRWYSSEAGQLEVTTQNNETHVEYMKNVDFEYTNVYTTVLGRFADFNYINIKAKGTPGKPITMRMYYGKGENELANVLGDDVSFSLSSEYEIHSLKVKNVYKTRMDLLRKVCIFPEIGVSNTSGEFYFDDVWFSHTLPENSTWENEGVDSGDSSIRVNGWRTENWTQYTLYSLGSATGIRYSKAAEYAFIETDIEINENDNGVEFKFENILIGNKPSVTCIRFLLRGDVERHVTEDVEYPYDVYYESLVYTYDLSNRKEDEFTPDENNLTTLRFSISSGIDAIGEHHTNGYRLTLLIESHPEDDKYYSRYRNGEMVIYGVSTIHDDDYDLEGWMSESWAHYQISKENHKVTISYSQTAESGSIQKHIDINENDNALEFVFENVNNSVANMRFYLKGDFKEHVTPVGEDAYDLYYEDEIYAYNINKDFEEEVDANNQITLKMPLMDALKTIGEHNKDGYFLKIFIESYPDDYNDYENSNGKLYIDSVRTFHDDWQELQLDGWESEEWTNYHLVGSYEGVHLRYKNIGNDYANITKNIDILDGHNCLTFKFKNNLDENNIPSVTCMRIVLMGDVKEHVVNENDEYDIYFEEEIYNYDLTNSNEQAADDDGVTTLEIPLYAALDSIGERHENGYKIKLLVESHPDDKDKIVQVGGDLYLKEVSTSYNENIKRNPYFVDATDNATYTLKDKEGVDKNITYTSIKGNAYFPRIMRRVETTQDQHIIITIRNNGNNKVHVNIKAGIYIDKDNFYPLWFVGEGYDGQSVEIDPLEEHEFDISADRDDLKEGEVINMLMMYIDNARGDEELYSGDVDIVSVVIV